MAELTVRIWTRRAADAKFVAETIGAPEHEVIPQKRGALIYWRATGEPEPLMAEGTRLVDAVLDKPILDEKIKRLHTATTSEGRFLGFSAVNP